MSGAEPIPGYQWLARAIARSGTTHVFFVDAVLRRMLIELGTLGVARILAHNEKTAAHMADGYARIAGRPGICCAQSVGAANLASGLQDAWLGRSPVIALTGRKPPAQQHRNAYQEIPHAPLFAPVTKFSAEVDAAADLPRLLRQAWRAALTGSPRPVHLDLNGLQAELIQNGSVAEPVALDPALRALPPYRPVPGADEILQAVALLAGAGRIAIVAGAGAVASGAGPEILALAERLAAPVGTSLGARGIIPTRHRLSIGTVGSYSAPPANRIVHAADLVVFIGCHTGDQVTHGWRIPDLATPILQIDIDPLELGRSYSATLGLAGDPKATLERLLAALGAPARDPGFAEQGAALVAEWRAAMAPWLASDAAPIRVERLCAEITRALPEDGILVADTGFSGIWTGTLIELNGAGQTYLRAAGTLGWAFPAALGAKCAAPDRPVVCFTGDGGLYYHVSELETAARRGIPVVVVVNNNSGFGQCVAGVRALQGNRPGDLEELVLFGPTDFASVARSFGVKGIRVEHPAAIAPALAEALAAGEPVVVDVATDIEARAPEAWVPK